MREDYKKLRKKMKKTLPELRYRHSVNVADTALMLAMSYGKNMDRAYIAGILHDCAKAVPDEDRARLCEEAGLQVTDVERRNPALLHAKLGAVMAEEEYGIRDSGILNAIRYHTTGRPAMTMLEKIIFVADYIEPMRDRAPRLRQIRMLAFRDIDRCVYEILADSVTYLQKRAPADMDHMTLRTYRYYQRLLAEREVPEEKNGSDEGDR